MSLIVSASGIRGTIGGKAGENLTPTDIVRFSAAYATYLRRRFSAPLVYIGRDSRISGEMMHHLTSYTLVGCGVSVIDVGAVPTPTVGVAVKSDSAACGGVILTASHNPINWNALKLLNENGEFLSAKEVAQVLDFYQTNDFTFVETDALGTVKTDNFALQRHVDKILASPLVRREEIARANYKIVVDGVNSVGGFAVPYLLEKLGVKDAVVLNGDMSGRFAHAPEPLAENLGELSEKVKECGAALGIAVDPDADRLVLVDENGEFFNEEYTLVACADYILSHTPGPVVGNLSTTRALGDVTRRYNQQYSAAPVGEAFVVAEMKRVGAVIGGEGNGGVIYPPIHFGRDALGGTALFLSLCATLNLSVSQIKARYEKYYMVKSKIALPPNKDAKEILRQLTEIEIGEKNTADGLKIERAEGWIQYRLSNTEPIIRVYTEARDPQTAKRLADEGMEKLQKLAI